MKSINIQYFKTDNSSTKEDMIKVFNEIEGHNISEINWPNYSYKPNVFFKIYYSDYGIYLKYDVSERSILGTRTNSNDPVYRDSCVEFFVAPGDGLYYNFEFNCIGTKYGGYGESRESGGTLDLGQVELIRTFPSLGTDRFDEKIIESSWDLIVEIPFKIFTNKSFEKIKGNSMDANFYKCGDELSVPHFVTWNKIDTKNPDFHRPEFFGKINFI